MTFRETVQHFTRSVMPMTAVVAPSTVGILVVDDEEAVLKYADRVLRRAGYEPLLASSGAHALEVVSTMDHLDVLITDLLMPNMNGDTLVRGLRRRDPDLKVLYLTGFRDRLFDEKPVLWKNEAFLDKPCSVQGLQQAVSLLLQGRLDPSTAR